MFGLIIAQLAGGRGGGGEKGREGLREGEVIDKQSVSQFASFTALCLQMYQHTSLGPRLSRCVRVCVRSKRTGSPPALQGL